MKNKRVVGLLLALSLLLFGLHMYDWTLHLEDNDEDWSVPWEPPYKYTDTIQYTHFWTVYWGVASAISALMVALLYQEYRKTEEADLEDV